MIYNIPFCKSLLDDFSNLLLNEVKHHKEKLNEYIILLPNLRLLSSLQRSFLNNSNAQSLILPKMISIENLDYFLSDISILTNKQKKDLHYEDFFKNTISLTQRNFILSRLIIKKDPQHTPSQALHKAQLLGEIIDRGYEENLDFNSITKIIDSNLANHWQEIIQFLDIALNSWHQILSQKNMIDIAYKKTLIYNIQNELWKIQPPNTQIIALNISSYFKSVISLQHTINNLKNGRLFFYGIDNNIFTETTLSYNHPQKVYQYMFEAMNVKQNNIKQLCKIEDKKETFIHRLFDTNIYKKFSIANIKNITNKLSIIATKNEEIEAKTIALILRETLQTPNKTAGFISNNQSLIFRVKNELLKWNLEINDYLGEKLTQSNQAKFFLLVGEIINNNFEPTSFLSLLKHPFFHIQKYNQTELKLLIDNLDLHIMRNSFYNNGFEELYNNCNKNKYPDLFLFLKNLEEYFKDFKKISSQPTKKINFSQTLIKHIQLCEALCKYEDNFLIWSNQEGKELSLLLAKLIEESQELDLLNFKEYLNILTSIIDENKLTHFYNKHPRLFLYGNLQSIGIQNDIMIISNLNENATPYIDKQNPWLNKYMMKNIGMLSNDYKIGLQANVFCQILGSSEVVLSRSQKDKGNLTTPSRWLLKLITTLQYYKIDSLNHKAYLSDFAQHYFNNTNISTKISLPFFSTTQDNFKKISATKVELLIQNPYVFFIQEILKIKYLENINPPIQASVIGTLLHNVLEDFFKNLHIKKDLSYDQMIFLLLDLCKKYFNKLNNDIIFSLFKLPALKNTLNKFIELKINDIHLAKEHFIECLGELNLTLHNNTNITLVGKADRITLYKNNSIEIADYKTSSKDSILTYQRQLEILSLILYNNGFKNITFNPKLHNLYANYIYLPKTFTKDIKILNISYQDDIQNQIDTWKDEIINLLNNYLVNNQPYLWTTHKNIASPYLHFARYLEFNTNLDDLIEEEENNE